MRTNDSFLFYFSRAMVFESPVNTYEYAKYRDFFNMTSTYRKDSDFASVYEDYAHFYWKENFKFDENFDFYADKTKFAAAIISNCGGTSKRLKYINEMRKLEVIDIYGRCGNKWCSDKYMHAYPSECRKKIAAEYKFFLAFENSHCVDYITEKFFFTLNFNIIPVVLGGGDYSFYVSFIFFL